MTDTAAQPETLDDAPERVIPAVSARDLSLQFTNGEPETRSVAVNGATFEIAAGEVLAVVGDTGSGKSTLARAVALHADLLSARSPRIRGGELDVLGTPVRGIRSAVRERLSLFVGDLPQGAGDALSPRLTVAENVAEPIYERDPRFDQQEAGEMVATLIDAVHLPLAFLTSLPHELSKGQRQRVAIARSLILEPSLLVADDPTAGIDVTVRAAILDTLMALQHAQQFAGLVVTTDLREARRLSTGRLAVMHAGIMVAIGEFDEVLGDPRHPYVERLARWGR